MKLKIIHIAMLLLAINPLIGQNFNLKNFQVEDGLPSSQVFDINQDSKGNVWLGTDLGLTQYNGYKFETFSEKNGLSDNSIVKIHVDHLNRVWCLGANRSISIWDNNKISEFPFNQELIDNIGLDFIRDIYVDSSSTLLLSIAQPCNEDAYIIAIEANGNTKKILNEDGFYIDYQLNGIFGGNSCIGTSTQLLIKQGKQTETIQLRVEDASVRSVAGKFKETYIVTDQKIFPSDYSSEYYLQSTSTGASRLDGKGNLWVCTYSGVLCFPEGRLLNPIHSLPNTPITCVFEDRDGSIWIGSQSKGLFYIKNLSLRVLDDLMGLQEPNINTLIGNKDIIYFSDSRNNLYSFEKQLKKLSKASSTLSDVSFYQGEVVFLESRRRSKSKLTLDKSGISLFGANKLWVGDIYAFSAFQGETEVFNSTQIGFQKRVTSIFEDSTGAVWVGSLEGLYRYDGDQIELVPETKGLRIDDISMTLDALIFTSRGNGVGIINSSGLTIISEDDGLISNFTNDLFVLENVIWVATNGGASRIEGKNIQSYSTKDGFPTSEFNVVWANDKEVYFGTRKGLVMVNKDYFHTKKRKLQVDIVSVLNGEKTSDFSKTILLPYEQNGLTINILARDFRIDNPIQYRYRTSEDSSWSYTAVPSIQYGTLPPGKVSILVSAQNEDGVWGPTNSSISVKVAKPYYLQWWFFVISIIMIGFFSWLIAQWRFRQARKAELNQNELNVLKIKALSSQMNPHFIFNSLNSIQNFLVDNDVRMSNKYLSKFARLMRLILNNSNNTFVPLKDVLSTLELYMELEQLRFDHKFQYKVIKEPRIDVEKTRVPSMLLQPFLENAILHGILPKSETGLISLELKLDGHENVKAIIRDDGVGRAFHQDKLGKKHKSHGLRITEERLRVFESLLGNKFNLSIRDLKDEEGKPKGTEVELTLPQN